MTSTPDLSNKIIEAEAVLYELEKLKKDKVTAFEDDGVTITPTVVWKFDGYMQAALYRVTDISVNAIDLWRRVKPVSSIILARSIMETVGSLWWLLSRTKRKIDDKNFTGIDEDIQTLSFASKIASELPDAPNAMNYIDAVDKLLKGGFRHTYNILCEACHPNHIGTLWAYSELNAEKYEVTFFSQHPDAKRFLDANMTSSVSVSLYVMQLAIGEYDEIRPKLIALSQLDALERKQKQLGNEKTPE